MWWRPETNILRDMNKLPRWAKVAYAARCARIAFPLFAEHWPNALAKRAEAIAFAIRLAERSAAEGMSFGELEPPIIEAVIAAGVALKPFLGFKPDEPEPKDQASAHIVSLVANSAASAVKALEANESEVTTKAIEGYEFARAAAMAASASSSLLELEESFVKLMKVAKGGIWRRSPTLFPPNIFEV